VPPSWREPKRLLGISDDGGIDDDDIMEGETQRSKTLKLNRKFGRSSAVFQSGASLLSEQP
jgi:hypothetical protein